MDSREYARERKQWFYVRQREFGLCLECRNPAVSGGSRCSACLKRRRDKRIENEEAAKRGGLCAECYREAVHRGNRLCLSCFAKNLSNKQLGTRRYWRELVEKFDAQGGRCAYSGRRLTLTEDTELDHIVPKTRGGANNIDNVHWVLASVNRMKRNLTEAEFFELVLDIYRHMSGDQG